MNERHNFKKGEVVTIFQMSHKGLMIEGDALIEKVIAGEDRYVVRFYRKSNGQLERDKFERYADPNGQADPVDYVKQVNEQ